MAVIPERKNTLVLARDFRDKITQRTGINDFDSDSKTEALISVFVDQVLNARNEAANAFYANQISTAKDKQLDQIGQDIGLPRLAETFAKVERRDQNVAFYVSGGTFGSLNGGADITIPAGTEIYSEENQNDLGSRVVFKVVESRVLEASRSIAYVSVRAVASGTSSNLGGGMLINHNFTGYSATAGLQVVNFFAILSGRPAERDRSYRFRLSRRYDTLVSSNNAKLHLEALRVPGVLDTRIINGYFGVGTVGVIVLGPENQSSASSVRGVQRRLAALQGPSSSFAAVPATRVSFDIEMEVRPIRALNASEKRQFELRVRRALRNYLRSQGIAGTVSLQDAAAEIALHVQGTVRLTSLGKAESIFNTVYIRKGPATGFSTERELLKNSLYTLDADEFGDLGTLSIRYL